MSLCREAAGRYRTEDGLRIAKGYSAIRGHYWVIRSPSNEAIVYVNTLGEAREFLAKTSEGETK